MDLPSNPNRYFSQVNNIFMLGDFIKRADIGASSKYLTRFYESQHSINEVYASLTNARNVGEFNYAQELALDRKLLLKGLYGNAKPKIDTYLQQIRAIRADKHLMATAKAERIRLLQQKCNSLAEIVDKQAREWLWIKKYTH